MADSPVMKLRRHLRQLKDDRRTWEPFWKDAKKYVDPSRGRFLDSVSRTEVNKGDYDDVRVNSEASRALGILASGIQSGLTSKARQWFMLEHPDPQVNRSIPVRTWYGKVQEILEGVFRRSNIYSSLLHCYREMALFGTAALLVLEHPEKTIYCRSFTTGTYWLSLGKWMDVDGFFYVEYLTARQLEAEYGRDVLPESVVSALNSFRYDQRFETINGILRHPEVYGLALPEGKAALSVHFLARGNEEDPFLRVGYYDFWPVMTPRWDVIDVNVYGVSPTRDVLSDVKMLQRMETDCLKGIAKGVTPPMRVPPELERRGLNLQPGAMNVVSNMNEHAVAPIYAMNQNVQQLQAKIDSVTQSIKDGYFNSLFLALLSQDNPQMTAREVAERHEEKLLMLGPVLERIHYELLDPLIARVFQICVTNGMIPQSPTGIDLGTTQIEYVSILSQAQKAVGASKIEQSIAFLGSMIAVYPQLRHAVDPRKAFMEYNNTIGVHSDIFTSESEYKAQVEAEQKQQQLAEAAPAVESYANSAKTMSEVNPADIQRLLGGQGVGV